MKSISSPKYNALIIQIIENCPHLDYKHKLIVACCVCAVDPLKFVSFVARYESKFTEAGASE